MCIGCRADLVPTGPRESEAHAGVRFGDKGPDWSVKLDGELVGLVFECVAGDPGWLLRWAADPDTDQLHGCRSCGQHEACFERLEGRIEVTRQPTSGARFGVPA